jgi:mRNA-degrading endonuclease RelE of RelBE toxin-antitoxin system
VSYKIAYAPKAFTEYEQTVTWYVERSQQAAENFEAALNERMVLLRNEPARYKKTYKQFREVRLKGYPYSIIYFIDDSNKQVILFSIHHHRKNPRKKYRETP